MTEVVGINHEIYNIECSPSYIINNLSQSKNSIYFIHNSQSFPRVLVINKTLLKEKNTNNKCMSVLNSSEKNEMLFVKSFLIKDVEYIAVGLYNGFKLWNKDGNRLLHQISNSNTTNNKKKIYAFICCAEFLVEKNDYQSSPDSIISGDNYGNLFLIFGSKSNWKNAKIFSSDNSEAILSIATNIEIEEFGISLDNGNVLIMKLKKGKCDLIKKFEENGKKIIAVNSVIFSKEDKSEFFLGCGFINGEIRIYSMKDYNWKFSINSNLRSIGPMIVKNSCEIIVGSDDGQINIWKYDNKKNSIILKNNFLFEDKMIVGLAYDNDDNVLYANSYDYPEIIAIFDI